MRIGRKTDSSAATEVAKRDMLICMVAITCVIMLLVSTQPITAWIENSVRRSAWIGSGEIFALALLLNFALLTFSWRRYRELERLDRVHREAEARVHLLETRDAVTQLPNRRVFEKIVQAMIETAEHADNEVVLLALEVDKHNLISDLYGYATADQLLRQISDALTSIAPPNAIVARTGNKEFAIAFECGASSREAIFATVERIAARLQWRLLLADRLIHVTCTMGATSTFGETVDFPELVRRAQTAMHFATRNGPGQWSWFGDDMDIELRSQSALEDAIRAGIPAGEFVPFFEVQTDLQTSRITGFELLSRWNHPVFGGVSADRFISVAEQSGLIGDLSLSVMRQALEEARHWHPSLTLSVNISPLQMKDEWLAEKFVRLLVETKFPANRLEVEITETALMEDFEHARTLLVSLKNQGIRLALDDFGTGYSSLQYLRSLPFDRIKIDKSFVQAMDHSAKSGAIVSTIVSLGRSLGLPITAEGVETIEAMAQLRDLGCEKGQGWFFGRPMPATEVRKIAAAIKPDMAGEARAIPRPAARLRSANPAA